MNEDLQRKLSDLENLIALQKDCVGPRFPESDYMSGMLNGLICGHSVIDGSRPIYHEVKTKKINFNKIRHKSKRRPILRRK